MHWGTNQYKSNLKWIYNTKTYKKQNNNAELKEGLKLNYKD